MSYYGKQKAIGESKARQFLWNRGLFDTDYDNDGEGDAGIVGNFIGNISLLSIAKVVVSCIPGYGPLISMLISVADSVLNYAAGNITAGQMGLSILTSVISYGAGAASSVLSQAGSAAIEAGKTVGEAGMYYVASAGVQGAGNLINSGLKLNENGQVDWYMENTQFASWGVSTFANVGLAYLNAGYNPQIATTWEAAGYAIQNWAINSTVNFINKGWKVDSSGRLIWNLDEGKGEVTEAFMDLGIGTLKSGLSFALEGNYTGYGTKQKESLIAFALGKGMDIYKYQLYQQGAFGSALQKKYEGQNAFDLAGGIDLTLLSREWKDNGRTYNGAASLRILTTGLELHSGAGEFGGFGWNIAKDGDISWNMKKTWENTMDNFRDIGKM